MTFVDTGAWAALFVPADPLHETARQWLAETSDHLITSYVVDQVAYTPEDEILLTGLNSRRIIAFGEHLSRLVYLTSVDVERAWKIFRLHADKRWSFTDCASLAVMERMRISKAFAFDRHFSQMRGVQRVPE